MRDVIEEVRKQIGHYEPNEDGTWEVRLVEDWYTAKTEFEAQTLSMLARIEDKLDIA